MGIVDKTLKLIGYTKSLSTSNPAVASFFRGGEAKQIQQPYSNVPAVYKSVKAIIDNAANVSLEMMNSKGEETEDKAEIGDLFNNVKDQSGRRMTRAELIMNMTGYMALNGECFFLKNAETDGELKGTQLPKNLQLINPKNVEVVTTNIGNCSIVSGWRISGKEYVLEQVIQIKDFNPYSQVRGVSPIQVIMDELRIETGASEHIWALFENGAAPGMIIETERDMQPEQQKAFRTAWESRHKGSNKSGKMGLLSGGAKAKQFGMSNVDLQLSELISKSEEKIIGLWRVPKAMFGYTDNLNRATFLGQLNVFYNMTIIPMLNRFEDSFNKEIVEPYVGQRYTIKFDYSNVEALSEQVSDKIDTAVKLFGIGFTRNEINTKLDLGFDDNTAWGNVWLVPFSQVPAGGTTIADNQAPVKELKKKAVDDLIEHNGLTYTPKQFAFAKNFNKLHDGLHKEFTKAVKGYFDGLRKRVLDAMDDSAKGFATVNNKAVEINIDWNKEASILTSDIQEYERQAMEQGVATGVSTTGIRMNDDIKYLISNATTQRLKFVVDEVSETNQAQVNATITKLIDDGSSVDELKTGIKQYFNKVNNRAETIARTEITAQLNGGLLLQYDQAGIKQKQWITQLDEHTRDAHSSPLVNGQIVDTNKAFIVDGEQLMMPGGAGGSAGNVINCRCSVYPVMEE